MTYRLPPLNGLRAFEAAARHLSFKHAAGELCVTASGVSQQVKGLETTLGVDLFRRLPRGLLLTDAGEAYLKEIGAAFHLISAATDALSADLPARRWRLGVAPGLGADMRATVARRVAGLASSVVAAEDLALVLEGTLDALLRGPMAVHPGLHLDTLEIDTDEGARIAATLAVLPGMSGCREHMLLCSALAPAAQQPEAGASDVA
ncbi:MAG: LysR family transcriptional regulator [Pseudomonadota bacterium]